MFNSKYSQAIFWYHCSFPIETGLANTKSISKYYKFRTNIDNLALFYFSESWILKTVFWILCYANMVSGNKILILINVVHAILALKFLIACYQFSCKVKSWKWCAFLKKYYFQETSKRHAITVILRRNINVQYWLHLHFHFENLF